MGSGEARTGNLGSPAKGGRKLCWGRPRCALRMKASLALLLLLALPACDGGEVPTVPPDDIVPEEPPAVAMSTNQEPEELDAEKLYLGYCAMCHGETGDGKGIVPLDRPARSFLAGGFSFGNTPTAVARTISSGIGGTPMPGFGASLSEAQCRALAEYVIAFGPEQLAPLAGESEMLVENRPVVVRGTLPPIVDGRPLLPRGLLVGGMDGLSWEYEAQPLRLLGVRQGAFVNRADWGERGGAALEPLGNLLYVTSWEETRHDWAWTPAGPQGTPGPGIPGGGRGAPEMPLTARLKATEIVDGIAWVEYSLLDTNGREMAVIRETGEALSVGDWAGFQLMFEIETLVAEGLLLRRPLRERELGHELARLSKTGQEWLVHQRADGSAEVMAALPAFLLADGAPGVLEETHLFGLPWNPETQASLMEDLR